jgi:hypothetical protein
MIILVRNLIREHRDQIGDFRCWVDDEAMYHKVLPELSDAHPILPGPSQFHQLCEAYFNKRQDPKDLEVDPLLDSRNTKLSLHYDPEILDSDLKQMSPSVLSQELAKLLGAIRLHRSIPALERTYISDRELYMALPEKKEAATKLPSRERFLGKGCPAYNAHCQANPEDFSKAVWNSR